MYTIKNKFAYLILSIVFFTLFFSFFRWNDYRQKELVDVLDSEKITEIRFNVLPLDASVIYNTVVTDEESIQELMEFFSQYHIKKQGRRDFTSKHPEEQFTFQIGYHDKRITLPSLIERAVVLIEDDQYILTNGPIDYTWIENFKDKHSTSLSKD